jgi:hypothetical protein
VVSEAFPVTATVPTTLNHGIPPADGARAKTTQFANPATGKPDMNFEYKAYQVQIENFVRGKEDTVSLDTTGFQFYNRPSKLKSLTNEEEIRSIYYPEAENLIKELTGASKVVLFDHSELSQSRLAVSIGLTSRNSHPS